jgi:hypothetical protein
MWSEYWFSPRIAAEPGQARGTRSPEAARRSATWAYWSDDTRDVAERLGSRWDGLSAVDAARRLVDYGPNVLRETRRLSRAGSTDGRQRQHDVERVGHADVLHLRPAALSLLVVLTSWRWPWIGAVAEIGYTVTTQARVVVEAYNLFDAEVSDIDYFYRSRLPGEPLDGIDDVHLHPSLPRTARVTLRVAF